MSLSEEKKILLSQLVDGELPVDQANQVLAEVFDELADVLGNAEAGRATRTRCSSCGRRSIRGGGRNRPKRS